MPISATTAFDSGGGVSLTVDDATNHIDMTMEAETGANSPGYFLFRLDGAAGETVSFTVTNLADTRVPAGYRFVYSPTTAPENFTRFDESADGGFTQTFADDPVYISNYQTYPYGEIVNRVQALSAHEHVATEVIGQSFEGRDMHAIRITDPLVTSGSEKDVICTAFQHPGETQGMYHMDAVIDHILTILDDPTRRFEQPYIYHFVPDTNPDGIYHGYHRMDLQGNNLNREWGSGTPVEIANMETYFTMNTTDVEFGWDFHSTTNPPGGHEAVYYDPDAVNALEGGDTSLFDAIASHSLSLSGLRETTGGFKTDWTYDQFASLDALTEASTYREYTIAELTQEGEGFFSEMPGSAVVPMDGSEHTYRSGSWVPPT